MMALRVPAAFVIGGLLLGSLAAQAALGPPPPPPSAAAAAASACRTKAGAAAADIQPGLTWVCAGGGLNCAPIKPGGAHFAPNTVAAHADWAFDQYYQAHAASGPGTCFFGGVAALVPPPAGHYDLVNGGGLAYPTPPGKAGAGIGAVDSVAAGSSISYISPAFSGAAAAAGVTYFSVWTASSAGSGCTVAATVTYSFGGGKPARVESYKPAGTQPSPAYSAYTNGIGLAPGAAPAPFAPMASGAINVTVAVQGAGCKVNIMAATAGFPSFVTGPFQ
eukprot:SAG22_NODE_1_length_62449_cov_158.689270_61_plen_277_part_00